MSFRILVSLVLAAAATPAVAAPPAATIGINPNCCAYQPSMATIQAGQSVQFAASGFHPLRFVGDMNSDNACDANCIKVFPTAGTYGFFCLNHEGLGMTGVITVNDNPDLIFLDSFEVPLQPES